MEAEVDGSERHRRFDDVIAGAEREGGRCEILVPVGDDHGGNVTVTAAEVSQDRERVHAVAAVLEQQNVEYMGRDDVVGWRSRFEDFNRATRPAETLPRQLGVTYIKESHARSDRRS